MADDHDGCSFKPGHAADNGGVVGKGTVAVHLHEIREHGLGKVKRVGAVGMAGDQRFLPGREP